MAFNKDRIDSLLVLGPLAGKKLHVSLTKLNATIAICELLMVVADLELKKTVHVSYKYSWQ